MRASYPCALARFGSRIVGVGIKNCPFGSLAFRNLRATGSMLLAVRQGFGGFKFGPQGPLGFSLFATAAIAEALRSFVRLSGTSARESDPSRSRALCP